MFNVYPILVALMFNVMDLVLGILSAIRLKEIKSSKLRDGLFKKVGFIACYFLAFVMDNFGKQVGFSLGTPILPVIITYVCTTELVSIIENISKINPDILPAQLTKFFDCKGEK